MTAMLKLHTAVFIKQHVFLQVLKN